MPPLTVNAHVVDASSAPATGGDAAPLRERPTVGPSTDFPPLEQTIVELDPGASAQRQTGADEEEVLFVLNGAGSLELNGAEHELEPESGAYLAPDEEYRLRNTGTERLTLISVRVPDPDADPDATDERKVVRRVADQQAQAA